MAITQPIYIRESDVERLMNVSDAIGLLRQAFTSWPQAGTINLPRQRARLASGTFHLMGASYEASGVYGLKAYFGGKSGAHYHTLLYAAENGRLLAIIESNMLGQLRTGAASGLASDLLANADARILSVIGTGKQARMQVLAIGAVRPLAAVRVFGRDTGRRNSFAKAMELELNVEVKPSASAQACVEDADIVVTITNSAEPVCRGAWLAGGAHVNAAGANTAGRREVDADAVLRSGLRVTDDRIQARGEAAEFRDLAAEGRLNWDDVVELGDLVAGKVLGRKSRSEITLFKSLGVALEDVALGKIIFDRAQQAGIGRTV